MSQIIDPSRRELIEGLPLFFAVSSFGLSELCSLARWQSHRAGDFICRRGRKAEGLFIVEHGRIDLVAPSLRGEQHLILRAAAGDFFGEASLVEASPWSFNAIAREKTHGCWLRRDDMTEVYQHHGVDYFIILQNLVRTMASRLSHLEGRVTELAAAHGPAQPG